MPELIQYKPKVFVSEILNLRITPPPASHYERNTGEAVYGMVIVFDNGIYFTKNKKEEQELMNHPAFKKDFHLQDSETINQGTKDKVVDVLTIGKK